VEADLAESSFARSMVAAKTQKVASVYSRLLSIVVQIRGSRQLAASSISHGASDRLLRDRMIDS
jgi:hypothetical protein